MASDPVRLALTCKAKVMSLEKTLNLEFALYGYLHVYAISAKCGSRGGDRGSGPPLENHKLYGFLLGISNWTPLEKVGPPLENDGPPLEP